MVHMDSTVSKFPMQFRGISPTLYFRLIHTIVITIKAMNEEKYGDRADVYSFGLLLWQLITAKVSPFNLMFVFTYIIHFICYGVYI